MAYRLACELPGKVAAIGPVAATMTVPCENPQPRPTGVLHIHGLDDRNVTTVTSASCAAGTLVELVTVAGAGHQWPGSAPPTAAAKRLLDLDDPSTALDATAVLWDFFSRQPQ